MSFRLPLLVAALVCTMSLTGPTSASAQTNSQRDAVIGGVAGAIIGGIAGKQNDETPEGIAIGGVAGAIAGHMMGKAKDRYAQEQLQQQYYYQQQATQAAQQQEYQQAVQLQKAVSIQDVISMSNSGVSPQLIINQIQSTGVQQEIGVSEIIALHQNGVSELVINAMQHASIGGVASPTAVAQSSTVFVESAPVVVTRQPQYSRPTIIAEHGNHREVSGSNRGCRSSHEQYQRRASSYGNGFHMHR